MGYQWMNDYREAFTKACYDIEFLLAARGCCRSRVWEVGTRIPCRPSSLSMARCKLSWAEMGCACPARKHDT